MAHSFRGGIHPDPHKITAGRAIEALPAPKMVQIPLSMHIGVPSEPLVKAGEHVKMGQKIGDTDAFVSVPVHATVSGTVKSVGMALHPNGARSMSVIIENDGQDEVEPLARAMEWQMMSPDEMIALIREAGIVGHGGAAFPTHVKIRSALGKVDTMIVNAAECEPYITVDYRECIENGENILEGVYKLQEFFKFKQVIIAIEDNKPKAFKVLKEIADKDNMDDDVVKLMTLKSRYPQGAEKMMVLSATGRKVPPGKLPADVGCVVMNVASVAFVGRYLKTGKPLISRSITVDGTAIKQPKNLRVPIGTNLQDIIDYCGGFIKEPRKIIFGGPMMGVAICDTNAPLCKQNNALLSFADSNDIVKKERDCIRCGRCVDVCPMSLMPTLIERFAKIKDVEDLKHSGVMVCMECGSCAYTCPSGRPLVQYMRLAKQILREESAK